MSATSISEQRRLRIRTEAGNRCGYCLTHQDYVPWTLEIEHIVPLAAGGSNEAVRVARELAEERPDLVLLYQYGNAANADALRAQAASLGLPADAIVEVSEVNPAVLNGGAGVTSHAMRF